MNPNFDGQLPIAMSSTAAEYDGLYFFIYWFSIVFTIGITGAMLYFLWKYKRKAGDRPHKALVDMTKLEIFWTVVPIILIVPLFHYGFKGFVHNAVAAENSIEIRVRAKQWLWSFEYANGMQENNEVYFPVNTPIKMVMSSEDVIHSFYVPEFRQKKDIVPGMYSSISFTPTVLGDAHIFCAEYCGTSHSGMLGTIHIVTRAEYDDHLKKGPQKPDGLTDAQWGEKLFSQNGCVTCHSVDDNHKQCPQLKNAWHRQEKMAKPEGLVVDIDENYIKESILKPQAKIVAGYTNVVMPMFALSDGQIDALIAYVKTLH